MLENLADESRALLGAPLTAAQLEKMEAYAARLVAWNERFNLTALRTPEDIRVRHFLDSLSCLTVLPDKARRLVDVGTGAGFPGLVLKIARPGIELTLVESVGKKAGFCRMVAEELGMRGVTVLEERAEALGQDPAHREAYDAAVARAVAAMPVLAEYLLPLVKVGGIMLAQKGAGGMAEIEAAAHAVEILGGQIKEARAVEIPGESGGGGQSSRPPGQAEGLPLLVVYEKVKPTPAKYPRRVGIPAKRPL